MRYVVASNDCVGNSEKGWDINDQHQIGTIDVEQDVIEDDQLILDVLSAADYLDSATVDDYIVVGDETCFDIIECGSDRPVLSLRLQQ